MLRTAVHHLRRSSHHLRQSLHDGRERLQGSVARLQEITSTATAYGSLLGSGILGGALGGLVGLGAHGGAITFPALIMVNYSQAVAAGTSGVVVAAIGISGTFGALFLGECIRRIDPSDSAPPHLAAFGSSGKVDIFAAAVIGIGATIGAHFGPRLTSRLSPILLQRLFGVFQVATPACLSAQQPLLPRPPLRSITTASPAVCRVRLALTPDAWRTHHIASSCSRRWCLPRARSRRSSGATRRGRRGRKRRSASSAAGGRGSTPTRSQARRARV